MIIVYYNKDFKGTYFEKFENYEELGKWFFELCSSDKCIEITKVKKYGDF